MRGKPQPALIKCPNHNQCAPLCSMHSMFLWEFVWFCCVEKRKRRGSTLKATAAHKNASPMLERLLSMQHLQLKCLEKSFSIIKSTRDEPPALPTLILDAHACWLNCLEKKFLQKTHARLKPSTNWKHVSTWSLPRTQSTANSWKNHVLTICSSFQYYILVGPTSLRPLRARSRRKNEAPTHLRFTVEPEDTHTLKEKHTKHFRTANLMKQILKTPNKSTMIKGLWISVHMATRAIQHIPAQNDKTLPKESRIKQNNESTLDSSCTSWNSQITLKNTQKIDVMETLQNHKTSRKKQLITCIPQRNTTLTRRRTIPNAHERTKDTRNPTWKNSEEKQFLHYIASSSEWANYGEIQSRSTLPKKKQPHREDRTTHWKHTTCTHEKKQSSQPDADQCSPSSSKTMVTFIKIFHHEHGENHKNLSHLMSLHSSWRKRKTQTQNDVWLRRKSDRIENLLEFFELTFGKRQSERELCTDRSTLQRTFSAL